MKLSWVYLDCVAAGVLLIVFGLSDGQTAGNTLGAFVWLRLILFLLLFACIVLVLKCNCIANALRAHVPDGLSVEASMLIRSLAQNPWWNFMLEAPKYVILATIWTNVAAQAGPGATFTSPLVLGAWILAVFAVAGVASILWIVHLCTLSVEFFWCAKYRPTDGSYKSETDSIHTRHETVADLLQLVRGSHSQRT